MAQQKPEPAKAPVFEKADLVKNAPAVFGVTSEFMAGALHPVEKRITKAKAQELLDNFKTKEVKR